jgi:hypothetical protein
MAFNSFCLKNIVARKFYILINFLLLVCEYCRMKTFDEFLLVCIEITLSYFLTDAVLLGWFLGLNIFVLMLYIYHC